MTSEGVETGCEGSQHPTSMYSTAQHRTSSTAGPNLPPPQAQNQEQLLSSPKANKREPKSSMSRVWPLPNYIGETDGEVGEERQAKQSRDTSQPLHTPVQLQEPHEAELGPTLRAPRI